MQRFRLDRALKRSGRNGWILCVPSKARLIST